MTQWRGAGDRTPLFARVRQGRAMSGDFNPEQKRYLEGFVTGLQIARSTRGQGAAPAAARPSRPVPTPSIWRAQDARPQGRRQALRAGEVQARAAPVRRLRAPEGAGGEQRVSQAARQFPLALLRPVLRGAEPELLHVPAADAERHPHALAVRRRRRPRRALRRRLRPRHHPRQSAGARDRGRRTPSPWSRRSRTSGSARAAPAPTTSATSPARRPPASIRRS